MSKRKNKKSSKKGKGGQLNPNKKWRHLSMKQRERILDLAAKVYIKKREKLGRPLATFEKDRLIETMDLGLWIPREAIRDRFWSVFDREESKIQKRLAKENSDGDE